MTDELTRRIEAALTRLGEDVEPPTGWQARVLAAVREPRPAARWRRWLACGASDLPVMATAMGVAAVALVARVPPAAPLALTVEREAVGTMRGGSAHVGDVLHATQRGGDAHRALRVYRDGQLVAACPGTLPCQRAGDVLRADLALRIRGSYRFVAVSSPAPLLPSSGSYDADLARGDARTVELGPIDVP